MPEVRRLLRADLDALVDLETASFPPSDRFPRRNWRHVLGSRATLVLGVPDPEAGLQAAICWLLRSSSRVARMYSLAVHPTARGRGLGKLLVAASVQRLPRRCGILGLEVRPDNASAVGLYRALGFRPVAGLADYYGAGEDGMRMQASREAVAATLSPG
jgi:ribosomal protein S18 acetylase RimI-like enzyme